jgi:hypothetical protein
VDLVSPEDSIFVVWKVDAGVAEIDEAWGLPDVFVEQRIACLKDAEELLNLPRLCRDSREVHRQFDEFGLVLVQKPRGFILVIIHQQSRFRKDTLDFIALTKVAMQHVGRVDTKLRVLV